MGWSKRESLEFQLFIGLAIFLSFPLSYCQRGIWKWNMYLDKLLFLFPSWAHFACVCIPRLWARETKARAARLAILSRWATQYYNGERSREGRRGGVRKGLGGERRKGWACRVPGRARDKKFVGRGLGNASKEENWAPGAGGEGSVRWREGEEQRERARRAGEN